MVRARLWDTTGQNIDNIFVTDGELMRLLESRHVCVIITMRGGLVTGRSEVFPSLKKFLNTLKKMRKEVKDGEKSLILVGRNLITALSNIVEVTASEDEDDESYHEPPPKDTDDIITGSWVHSIRSLFETILSNIVDDPPPRQHIRQKCPRERKTFRYGALKGKLLRKDRCKGNMRSDTPISRTKR